MSACHWLHTAKRCLPAPQRTLPAPETRLLPFLEESKPSLSHAPRNPCPSPPTHPPALPAAAIFKCLLTLKTRNAIILCPHPRATKCTVEAARIVRDAAVAAGAPPGVVQWIESPSLPVTQVGPVYSLCLRLHRCSAFRAAAHALELPAYGPAYDSSRPSRPPAHPFPTHADDPTLAARLCCPRRR